MRKRDINTADIQYKMKEMLDADRRATVRGISADLGISASMVYNILKDLHMCKVSARWVPRLLKLEEKEKRVEKSSDCDVVFDVNL